jgi:hypothetical protein
VRQRHDTPGGAEAREGEPLSAAAADEHGAVGAEGDVAAEEAFIRGLLARGEAARAVDGKLPAGALYEIVEEPPGRLPKIVRRRFSR